MMVSIYTSSSALSSNEFKSVESDYRIFVWRQKSSSSTDESFPVLHVRNPDDPLPTPPEYQNPSFYVFKSHKSPPSSSVRSRSRAERRSVRSNGSANTSKVNDVDDGIPKFKKEFEKFQNESGVRTVMGSIGPVNNGTPWILSSFPRVNMACA